MVAAATGAVVFLTSVFFACFRVLVALAVFAAAAGVEVAGAGVCAMAATVKAAAVIRERIVFFMV